VTGGSFRRLLIVSVHDNFVVVGADGSDRVCQADGVSRGKDSVVYLLYTACVPGFAEVVGRSIMVVVIDKITRAVCVEVPFPLLIP
jgi:hypothetical protein